MIYLDYNATTPVRPAVRDAMLPYLGGEFGNPSSVHRAGSRARVAVESARADVAVLLGARANEIVFTSGGTESNNLAILGVAASRPGAIVVSAIEHSSVKAAAGFLEQNGRRVVRLGVDLEGRVDLDALRAAVQQQAALVSIAWANNEVGTIQAMVEIAAICRSASVPLHVDAVQALGKVAVEATLADLVSVSAHKIGGPKGTGALFVRPATAVVPLLHGGGQERGLRGGTENVAGIVGLGAACRLLSAGELVATHDTATLRERLWDGLQAGVNGIDRNSPARDCLPNTLNVRIAAVAGDTLVAALDLEDIAVSTGSACAAGAAEPSHVLLALGLSEGDARDAVRFSLGWQTTAAEIDRAVESVVACVARIRSVERKAVAHA